MFQVAHNGLHVREGLIQSARFLAAGKEPGHLLAQAAEELTDAFQIRPPGPFRPLAQALGRGLLVAGVQGLEEQARLGDHLLAPRAVRALVMAVPALQLTQGHRLAPQGL